MVRFCFLLLVVGLLERPAVIETTSIMTHDAWEHPRQGVIRPSLASLSRERELEREEKWEGERRERVEGRES